MLIEALDQLADTISAFQISLSGSLRKALSPCDRQQRFRSTTHIQSLAARFDYSTQFTLFLLAQRAQRLFLGLYH